MPVREDIKGLTEVGATAQTIALADVLYRDAGSPDLIQRLLNLATAHPDYSGHDADIKASLAAVLATIIRK